MTLYSASDTFLPVDPWSLSRWQDFFRFFQGEKGDQGSIPSLSPSCVTGKEGVFLERFHHKEANFSRSQADEIGHVCIPKEFEICIAAW